MIFNPPVVAGEEPLYKRNLHLDGAYIIIFSIICDARAAS